jgi:uncharacterized glyoxalase superfamily protein PhnB
MRVRFTGVCLITADVLALARFYAQLFDAVVEGDEVFAIVPTAAGMLSFYVESGMEQMAPGSMAGAGTGGCTLEFEVGDVDAVYPRLRALGVPVVKAPTTQPWGRRSVWLRDPDGNIVNLYQPVPALPAPVDVVLAYSSGCWSSATCRCATSCWRRTTSITMHQRAHRPVRRRRGRT